MNELIKIKDLSNKYDITTRTLRYYEDMGLLSSTRSNDYAYRLYDENAIKRLEQILILRKLNISIKDIQLIFNSTGTEVVLDVLGKKVSDIDGEVALLHELKMFVLEFIRQIQRADFTKDDDVKKLYEKAKEIEGQLTTMPEVTIDTNRLIEVFEQTDRKIPGVMVVKLPGFRAVTSGNNADCDFWEWMDNNRSLFKDIVWDTSEFHYGDDEVIYAVHDHVTEADTAPYQIITFEGGLYAAAVCVGMDDESFTNINKKIVKWLSGTAFVQDEGRECLATVMFPHNDVRCGLGYHQLLRYVPITLATSNWQCVYSLATDEYIQGIEQGVTWQGFEPHKIAPTGCPDYTFVAVDGRNGILVSKRANDWDGVNLHLDMMELKPNHYCSIEVRGKIIHKKKISTVGSIELTQLPGYENMAWHTVADGDEFTFKYMFPIIKDMEIPRARISSSHSARKLSFLIEHIEIKVNPFTAEPNYVKEDQIMYDVAEMEAFDMVYDGTYFALIHGKTPKQQTIIKVPAGLYYRINVPAKCTDIAAFRNEIHEKHISYWLSYGAGHELTGEIEVVHNNTLLISAKRLESTEEEN